MFDMHEHRLREACLEVSRRVRAAEQHAVESLLREQPEFAENPEQIVELVFAEFVARDELGQKPTVEAYCARFPHLHERLARLLKMYEFLDEEASVPQRNANRDTIGEELLSDATHIQVGKPFGEYEILEEIGRGGMGVVYKARHCTMRRKVALKVVRFVCDSHELRKRLLREARLAARLRHPNIVQVYQVNHAASGPYFAMEWVPGGSLDKRIGENHWSAKDAASLIRAVAEAIEFSHRRGVVHRDLKPANILIEQDGTPKISDFGLAKMFDIKRETDDPRNETHMTQTGAILGTPCYMAPEQVSDRKSDIGVATDVYALGAILYELLTGRPPFRGDSLVDTFRLVCSADPVSPKKLHPRLPRDLATICLKCLNKETSKRYHSAAALVDDLDSFLSQRPIRARPTGAAERAIKWSKRRPQVAALLGLVLVIAVAGFIGITSQARRALRGESAHRVAREAAEFNLYLSRIALAHQALRVNDTTRAREVLQQCAPQFRNWEWDYLSQLCKTELHTLAGHSSYVLRVKYSPDGALLVSTSGTFSESGEVIVWNALSGEQVGAITDLPGPAFGLDISPDGKMLAIGCLQFGGQQGRPTASLWDCRTLEPIRTLPRLEHTYDIAFDPSGETVAIGGRNGSVEIWQVSTAKQVGAFRAQSGFVSSLSFSVDGATLASSSTDGSACLWDLVEGRLRCRLATGTDTRSVAISPGGRQLVAAGYLGRLTTWDLTEDPPRGLQVEEIDRDLAIFGASYSRDGSKLALACEDGSVRVIETETGRRAFQFRGHLGRAADVTFHPDGQRIACGLGASVRVWELHRERHFRLVANSNYQDTTDIVCHPDGETVVIAVRSREGTRNDTRDDRFIAVRIGVDSGRESVQYGGHTEPIVQLALTPEGELLATASRDKSVRIWNADDGRELHSLPHEAPLAGISVSSESDLLLSGDTAGDLRLWRASTGELLTTIRPHEAGVRDLALHREGRFAASLGVDGNVSWIDLETARSTNVGESLGHSPASLVFSPDGRYLAASQTESITIWRVADNLELPPTTSIELVGHTAPVSGIAFSPNSARLASVGYDHAVRLWDVSTGAETLALDGVIFDNRMVPRIAFSPDAKHLASLWAGRVKTWSTEFNAVAAADVTSLAARAQHNIRTAQKIEEECIRRMIHQRAAAAAAPRRSPTLWRSVAFYRRRALSDLEEVVRRAPTNAGHQTRLETARFRLIKAEHLAGNHTAVLALTELIQAAAASRSRANRSIAPVWILANYPIGNPRNPKLALELGTELVAAQPTTWHRVILAVAQYRAGLWNDAIGTLRDPANHLGSGGSLCYYLLFNAMAEWQLGNHQEAQRFFRQAEAVINVLSISSANIPVTLEEAAALLQHDLDGLAIKREMCHAANDLAQLHELTNPDAAIEAARQGVALAPNDSAVLSTLGRAYYRAGELGHASEAFRSSIRASWGRPNALDLLYLANSQRRIGRLGEASRLYHEAVSWAQWQQQRGSANNGDQEEIAELISEAAPFFAGTTGANGDLAGLDTPDEAVRLGDAELRRRAEFTKGRVTFRDTSAFGPSWSEGSELRWVRSAPGAQLTITVDVPAAGTYTVVGGFTKTFDSGRFQLYVSDAPVGNPIDLFNFGPPHEGVIHTGSLTLGQAVLREGENQFTFEIVGKDPVSGGYSLGIDELRLIPANAAPTTPSAQSSATTWRMSIRGSMAAITSPFLTSVSTSTGNATSGPATWNESSTSSLAPSPMCRILC